MFQVALCVFCLFLVQLSWHTVGGVDIGVDSLNDLANAHLRWNKVEVVLLACAKFFSVFCWHLEIFRHGTVVVLRELFLGRIAVEQVLVLDPEAVALFHAVWSRPRSILSPHAVVVRSQHLGTESLRFQTDFADLLRIVDPRSDLTASICTLHTKWPFWDLAHLHGLLVHHDKDTGGFEQVRVLLELI